MSAVPTLTRPAVQSLWIGERLSTMGRLGAQSFLANGYPVHLYCFEPVRDMPAGVVLKDANEILPRDQVVAGNRGFRYKLLLDRGGWWVDTDVVCLRPFDFAGDRILASECADPAEGGGIVAAPSVIKQPVGSPLMRWAWRRCRQADPERVPSSQLGPRLLQESIDVLGCQDDVCPTRVFSPVPFYDWGGFVDPNRQFSFGPEVHAVHLFHQMWRAHGVDPDERFPGACLYEQLKRRYL